MKTLANFATALALALCAFIPMMAVTGWILGRNAYYGTEAVLVEGFCAITSALLAILIMLGSIAGKLDKLR